MPRLRRPSGRLDDLAVRVRAAAFHALPFIERRHKGQAGHHVLRAILQHRVPRQPGEFQMEIP